MTAVFQAQSMFSAALLDDAVEQAVLGCLMVDRDAFGLVGARLDADVFAYEANKAIYRAIAENLGAGKSAAPSMLRAQFADNVLLEDVGGVRYLAEIAMGAATRGDVADYADLLRDLAMRRRMIEVGGDASQRARRPNADESALDIIDELAGELAEIGRHAGAASATATAVEAADLVLGDIDAIARGEPRRGVSTGLRDLDRALGLWEPGELWVVGARPAMGKTALVTGSGLSIAESGGPVLFVSLEMSRRQLARRMLSAYSGVSSFALRDGRLSQADMDLVMGARDRIAALPFDIYVDRDVSIEAVVAAARRAHRARPLAALFVDYLQLMRSGGDRRENRVQELADISGALKSLALELDIPVVALSQLNRGLENREDKRPNLADLRESGAIEQDADGVLMLYREEEYHKRKKPQDANNNAAMADWKEEGRRLKGRAEIIVAKHRSGEAGVSVECQFFGATTTFADAPNNGGAHADHDR